MADAHHVLLVDDDPELTHFLQEQLQAAGLQVQAAHTAAQARVIITRGAPELAVLDVCMPCEDGLSLAAWIREHAPATRVLMLTHANEVADRVRGLHGGADDYLGKPFDLRELLARVQALLRRGGGTAAVALPSPGTLPFGRCRLDLDRRCLLDAGGREVPITAMEFDLLQVLAEHPHQALSRDALMALAHRRDWEAFDRSIDLRVMRLRRKIELDAAKPEVIKTIRGKGYMYVPR